MLGMTDGYEQPYEVHECVGRCNVSPLRQIRLLTQVLLASPRPDHQGGGHDDDEDGGDKN